jgi:tetraacyldisaccharide 4'-kinase
MQRVKKMLLRPRGVLASGAFLPLTLASYLYGLGCRLRAGSYRVGVVHPERLPCRVISVGNLTVGGTGKTPVVIHLAGFLAQNGRRVGIVSRGYGRQGSEAELLVSDEERLLSTPEEAGEEPFLMAQRLLGTPVMVSKRRADAGRILIERFGIDTLLLDDGFQHLGLHRDLNLLLIDATDPFGNGFLLPRGTLREPFSALSRADAILLTRMEQNGPGLPDRLDALLKEIARGHSVPVFCSSFLPTRLVSLTGGDPLPVGQVRGKSWFLFSGIGNPQAFRRSVERLGGKVVEERVLGDHCRYSERMVERLLRQAERLAVDGILTTEKDGVKVARFLPADRSVFALRIELAEVEELGGPPGSGSLENLVFGEASEKSHRE